MKIREDREICVNKSTTIFVKKDKVAYRSSYSVTVAKPNRVVRNTCRDRESAKIEIIKTLLREGWTLSQIRKL